MVYTQSNFVQFGYGDVNIGLSMAGSKKHPQAMLLLQNQAPRETRLKDLSVSDKAEVYFVERDPENDFALLFPDAKSIDIFISALQAAKEATFGEKNVVEKIMEAKEKLSEKEF